MIWLADVLLFVGVAALLFFLLSELAKPAKTASLVICLFFVLLGIAASTKQIVSRLDAILEESKCSTTP